MTIFNAVPFECVIQDHSHSKQPGTWPSGKVASDICSAHMANWHRAHEAAKLALVKPKSKLWWAGR